MVRDTVSKDALEECSREDGEGISLHHLRGDPASSIIGLTIETHLQA
jgi:hypothetical protein